MAAATTPPAGTAAPAAPRTPPGLRATYRVQLSKAFGFRDALAIVPYLHALGVSHLYASPILAARPGSTHGYDTADPTRLNPELGTEADFADLTDALRSRGMGLLLDIVPNHAAAHSSNPRWWDVLRHGRRSAHAEHFDIDWGPDPATPAKIVLPVLGAPLDEAVKSDLRVAVHDDQPAIVYHEHRFPLDPLTLGEVARGLMERALRTGDDIAPKAAEAWVGAIASGAAAAADAAFARLLAASPAARLSLDGALASVGADAKSTLLAAQAYRLTFWKDGLKSINYRRFFDVSDLVAVRPERLESFDHTHALPLRLMAEGRVAALRIDHIDGLHDPLAYLRRLRAALPADARTAPILVEKIFAPDESSPREWPTDGTTGYESLNRLNTLFVDPAGHAELTARAADHLGLPATFAETAAACKRLVIERLFPAEFATLGDRLADVASEAGLDVPEASLGRALRELTAGLRVYRTYIADDGPSPDDRRRIDEAAADAAARGNADAPAIDAVRRVLLGDVPEPARPAALAFTRRWQQFTGPVMAKGVEDTALYRHVVLASLNEVGSDPDLPTDASATLTRFHAANADTRTAHPFSLNATATHDTKRGEDARARLNVLASIPGEWLAAVDRWRALNAPHRSRIGDRDAPSDRDEMLFYQSLVAVWPTEAPDAAGLVERLQAYALKAAREAKLETSWSDPGSDYESALTGFIQRSLHAPDGRFLAEAAAFANRIAPAGAVNSLAQLVLKAAAPGVPDFYQGAELWDLGLVDPDNRRPVDFARRTAVLEALPAPSPTIAAELLASWRDARVKLFVPRAMLTARATYADLFHLGEYLPLRAEGPHRHNLVAFARRLNDRWVVAIAPRWPFHALRAGEPRIDPARWPAIGPASLRLPAGAPSAFTHAFTGEPVHAHGGLLDLAALLSAFPVALLRSV